MLNITQVTNRVQAQFPDCEVESHRVVPTKGYSVVLAGGKAMEDYDHSLTIFKSKGGEWYNSVMFLGDEVSNPELEEELSRFIKDTKTQLIERGLT